MKIQLTAYSILPAVFLASCAKERESQLPTKARISKAETQATALTKVPNGTLKDYDLEQEHGKLIWSFGFNTPDSKDMTEVTVDTITGDIVNVEHENAEDTK